MAFVDVCRQAALAAPDSEGQSTSVHRAMPRLPQVRPRSNGADRQQAAEQQQQQQQQQQAARPPRKQQQGNGAAAQAAPQHLDSRSSSPDDEPAGRLVSELPSDCVRGTWSAAQSCAVPLDWLDPSIGCMTGTACHAPQCCQVLRAHE